MTRCALRIREGDSDGEGDGTWLARGFRRWQLLLLLIVAAPVFAQDRCTQLTNLKVSQVTISQAKFEGVNGEAAAEGKPAICHVQGVIWPEVRFELWLPDNWNHKFLMVGNGGLAGNFNRRSILDPLQQGYAASSTDTGHVADNDGHWAAGHMERVIDFAHRGVHVTTLADKAIIRAYYSRAADRSYFQGCSQGGQQAMAEAQRYPDDFDGIIAGDPANYMTHLYAGAHMWVTLATQADPASYISAAKAQMIGNAVMQSCDAEDGIRDGIIADPRKCHFDPNTLLCKQGDGPDCLTAPQVEAARKIYAGATTAAGERIFPGIMPGSESGRSGWAGFITGDAIGKGEHTTLALPFMRYIAFDDPNWDFHTFSYERKDGMDSDVEFLDATLGPLFNNMNPDLSRFAAHGGKLLQYHGWADPDISPLNSVNYFESVAKFEGGGTGKGISRTQNFYRLFLVPGMNHCFGGAGTDTFDTLSTLEQWVEHGTAPDRIIASHATNGVVDMTRPLCAYPAHAVYKGTGGTNDAANFSCKTS
jgi:feruloyl esterase